MSKPAILLDEEDRLVSLGAVQTAVLALAKEINERLRSSTAASDLAATYVRAESASRQLEPFLAAVAKIVRTVKNETLPDLFEEQKTKSTTVLGHRVTTTAELRASIRGEKKSEAMAWLKEHGHGSLIKTDPSIHPQTLEAWAREMTEEGEELPEELFSLYYYNSTSITRARKSSGV
jgi:hypothetical protein